MKGSAIHPPEAGKAKRAIVLIQEAIDKLRLDLSGLTVLTEAGSGYFSFTPVIAATANAARVYTWTRDSVHGRGKGNISGAIKLLQGMGIKNKVEFRLNKRPVKDIERADIITNLGFVRPMDRDFIARTKPDAVISTMCEKWELRNGDIDVDACRKHKVRVGGVWESHPKLKIFDSVGSLAVKLCHEAGFEIYQNNIAVWSGDNFGKVIKKGFKNFGASNVLLINSESELKQIRRNIRLDFLFIADYASSSNIVGKGGLIDPKTLKDVFVIHLCGAVDYEFAAKRGLMVYPAQNGYGQRMTRTLAHLGMKPMIELHAAGLKVGELMFKNKTSKLVQRIV